MSQKRPMTDQELEAALYESNSDHEFIDPELQSTDSEEESDNSGPADRANSAENEEDLSYANRKYRKNNPLSLMLTELCDRISVLAVDIEHQNLVTDETLSIEDESWNAFGSTEEDDMEEVSADGNEAAEKIVLRRRPRPKAVVNQSKVNMVAPSGISWSSSHKVQRRQVAANVMKERPGLKSQVNPKTALESFQLFFDSETINIILQYTNQKLKSIQEQNTRSWFIRNSKMFQAEEIFGFIGFVLTTGVYKQNRDALCEIFSLESLPIYRATFAINRLKLLLKCLRFDDAITREARKKVDNFAAIREIWENVTCKFPNYLSPSESVVVDEELITFHGRCKFRLFIPTKPGKYGIEANALCDSEHYYCYSLDPYTGKVEGENRHYNSGPEVVKRLVARAKLENSGRNITMDRKFTSLPLTAELYQQKLTVVGTISHNRRDVPRELRLESLKTSDPGTVRFAFRDNETMVSYVPKKNKVVTLLSSLHRDMSMRDDKPEIIHYYNSTKAGVDTLDKCVRCYSCRRGTRRWPMAVLYNLIDISAYNSYIIFSKANPDWATVHTTRKSGRKVFLKDLGKQLCILNMQERVNKPGIHDKYFDALKVFGFQKPQPASASRGTVQRSPRGVSTRRAVRSLPKKGRCFVCPRSADRKYMKYCRTCDKYICPTHTGREEKTVMISCVKCIEAERN